jgi:hypothetical protein
MGSRKIEKAQHGPGLAEVVLGASLSLSLGVALALGYLLLKPAWSGKDLPRAPSGTIFYVEGSRDSNYSRQWQRKRQLFAEGNSVALNEDELNAWMMAVTMPPEPERPVAGAKFSQVAAPPSTGFFQLNTPNFRIRDGVLQVGSKGALNFELLGLKRQVILQAAGKFEKGDGGFVLVPDRFYIGSFPLHRLPGLSSQVLGVILNRMQIPEDLKAAWKKLANVTVEGSTLKLTMP